MTQFSFKNLQRYRKTSNITIINNHIHNNIYTLLKLYTVGDNKVGSNHSV